MSRAINNSSRNLHIFVVDIKKSTNEITRARQRTGARRPQSDSTANDILDIALCYLKSHVLHMPTAVDITKFFDGVVTSLSSHSDEIAANDLLPSIVIAISINSGFCSHAYSFSSPSVRQWE
jgi:hypothetical protein